MKRTLRLAALLASVAFFLAPFLAAAQAVAYPSCTDSVNTCQTGEVCAYVISGGGRPTPTIGTCTPLPGVTEDKFSYPSCMNNLNCAGHAGETCTYASGSGNVGICAIPPPSQPIVNGGCPAGTVPSGLYCVTPTAPPAYSGINTYFLQGYATAIVNIINGLVAPVLLAIAFIFFLFGVYRYFILGATSDTARETGRVFILWSIIGFVVIFSIWGLVAIVGSTFGLIAGGSAPPYPTL